MSTDARLRKIRARLGSLLRERDDEPPAKPFVIIGDSATDKPGPAADYALTAGSDVLIARDAAPPAADLYVARQSATWEETASPSTSVPARWCCAATRSWPATRTSSRR